MAEKTIENAKKEIQKWGLFGPFKQFSPQGEFNQKLSNINDYFDRGKTKEAYLGAISLAQESRNTLNIWVGTLWGIITGVFAIVAAIKTSLVKGILLFIILFSIGLFLLKMGLQI